jgi:hypothetical protein
MSDERTSGGPELEALFVRDLEREDPRARWLIEDLWGRSAVGIIGGCPKVGKSWLGLDLALSVASGTPALDHFPVLEPGRALVYLAEDALPQVRSRIESLCRHRRLDLDTLDLAVITAHLLRLDSGRDQQRLRNLVARLRPRLLLLDPLVRLHSLDENSSFEIARLLGYFRELQRAFDTAVILVHHTSKKTRARPGQSLRGSSDLHAFGDSNAYLFKKDAGTVLTLEHRSAQAIAPLLIELVSEGEVTYLAIREGHDASRGGGGPPSLPARILEVLSASKVPLSRAELRAQLRVNNQRLGDALSALEAARSVRRHPDGWAVVAAST